MEALIVDDEEEIGLITSIILKKKGIKSKDVNSIADAEMQIKKKNFGIYFLDLHLPDGTGFDLIPQIRKHNKNAVIIIISAYDDTKEIQKAEFFNVNAFIKKPFSGKEILNAIDQILKK